MRKLLVIAACSLPFALTPLAYAQSSNASKPPAASSTTKANTSSPHNKANMGSPESGWSVKDTIIGEAVYNENDDKVGDVKDITLSSNGKASYIVGAGGFLGMGEHDVAIAYDRIQHKGEKLVLAGFSKDELKKMPAYKARMSDKNRSAAAASTNAKSKDSKAHDNDAAMKSSKAGWSVKDDFIGEAVYNENNDVVGEIDGVILSSTGKASFIVDAGGFLGMDEHDLVIPFDKITRKDNKLYMADYTKDQLKEMPPYKSHKAEKGKNAKGVPSSTAANNEAAAVQAQNSSVRDDAAGWNVKDDIIGDAVYNENDDKVGDVTDITLSSDGMASYIVGAGGFLGIGEHNVSIPFDRIKPSDDKLIMAGYTKDQLKDLPAYKSHKAGLSGKNNDNSAPMKSKTEDTATKNSDAALTSSKAGWSVKDNLIGEAVYNENDEKVGDVTDLTVSSNGTVTAYIVGAGGFLGLGEHNVAIPFDRMTKSDDKLLLAGYTKDQLTDLPAYKSRKSDKPATLGPKDTPATPAAPANTEAPKQ
ncbi:PRC-barrel domain containing protein [Allopusillimonas ginsengisoli]|nr:PRC-barrel domain containing protein [Allopusillimonas ginsengisoli]